MESANTRQFKYFSLVWDELYSDASVNEVFDQLKDLTISNIRLDFKKVPFNDELIDQIVLKTLNLIIRKHCKENNYVPFKLKKSKLTGRVVAFLMEKRICSKCGKAFWWITKKWDSRDVYCSLKCKGELTYDKVVVSKSHPKDGYEINEYVKVIKI